MSYSISRAAQSDLVGIWEFTRAHWSAPRADQYLRALAKGMEYIASQPSIGKRYDSVRMGYRGFQVQSHIVFYRQTDDETVQIIRVLHKRMDLDRHLH